MVYNVLLNEQESYDYFWNTHYCNDCIYTLETPIKNQSENFLPINI